MFHSRKRERERERERERDTHQVVDLLQREADADVDSVGGVVARPHRAVVALEQLLHQPVLVRRNCNEKDTSSQAKHQQ